MKQLTCEMCGSTDLMKQDGVFVCQTCGCKYSVEEAKKLMVEITGEIEAIDSIVEVNNVLDTDNKEQTEVFDEKQVDDELVFDYSQMLNKKRDYVEKGNILFECKLSYIKDATLNIYKTLFEIAGKDRITTVSNFIFYERKLESMVLDIQPNGCTKDENFSELYSNLRYSVNECRYMVIYKILNLTIYVGSSSYTLIALSDKLGNLATNITTGIFDYVVIKKDIKQIIEILNKNGATKI